MTGANLIGSYNYALVALSVSIAMFASYAALDLASRVTAAGGWTRAVWLLGGAGAMGTGIWSMHYIGMLAFVLPVPVAYHWPTVLLSLFAAILASAIALYVVSRQTMGAFRALTGSVLMGAGIASMHYIGMAAMRVSAMCQFSSMLVVSSVVFAVLISLAALWITFHLRDEKAGIGWRRIAGAAVMGAAIPVMHYTGMAAATFTPSGTPTDLSRAVSPSTLGTAGVVAVTFVVLALALLTSWIDRRSAVQSLERQQEKLHESEAYLSEAQRLSHTGSFGWRVSSNEIIWSEETFRIFQYDRTITPTVEHILQRIHPEDAALVKQTVERASRHGQDFEHEYRLVMPDSSVKYVHVVAHALSDVSGGVDFVGAVMDVTGQHQARTALEEAFDEIKKSEGRLRMVIDTIPGMVWSGLPDGTFDFVSQPWLSYLGCSWEELSARGGLVSVVHPDDVERSVDRWNTTRATGRHTDHELRMRRADGQYRWFLTRALPLRDEQDNIVRWYGTATDIEDRKRAEMLLRGERRLLEMIARGDSRALILEALCRLVEELASGCLSSILLLDSSTSCLRHGAAPSLPASYIEAIDGLRIGPSAGSCGTAAFSGRPVVVSDIVTDPLWDDYRDLALAHELRACWSTPILSPNGRVLGTFAIYYREPRARTPYEQNIVERITHLASIAIEREQAEEAQLRLGAIVASSDDAIVSKTLGGIITSWNAGAQRIFGYTVEEAVGRPISMLIPPDRLDEESLIIDKLRRGESVEHFETIRITKDARQIHVSLAISPIRNPAGQIIGASKIARDITERKRAEEALRQAQAELTHVSRVTTMGELTASLAHEVKQPIAAAMTNANTCLLWLDGDTPDIDEARAATLRVVEDGRRATDIISRIHQLFTKGAPQREWIDVNELILEMIFLLRGEAVRDAISARTELAADCPRVLGDRVQLQQVLMNLIVNSIDAMKEVQGTRELVITSHAEPDEVLVSVSDTGVGLPPQVDHIFNAFFTTKQDGTGMGLSISRSIVESHGGRLWATDNPSRGASFHLGLPTSADRQE